MKVMLNKTKQHDQEKKNIPEAEVEPQTFNV